MKIALCFIISYEHILNKEDIWKQWIEPNKDIINTYFYYKDITKIKSVLIINMKILAACSFNSQGKCYDQQPQSRR